MSPRRIRLHPLMPILLLGLVIPVVLAGSVSPARAEEVVHLPDQPGQVTYTLYKFRDVAREMALSWAEQRVVKAKLDQLARVLRTHAIFNPPRGIDGVFIATLASPQECPQPPCRRDRVAYQLSMRLHQYYRGSRGIKAQKTSPRGITFTANQPGRVGEAVDDELKDDLRRPLLKEPLLVKTFAGVPLYDNGLMVLIRTKRPLFLPVTCEQLVRSRLRQLAREEGADQHPVRTLRSKLEAELAGMTPAQRQSEAWIGDSRKLSGLLEPRAEGARRVVIRNPAFLDPKLPRTAIQLLTAEVTILYGGDDALSRPLTLSDENVGMGDIRTSEFLRTFDFQKLVALIDAR